MNSFYNVSPQHMDHVDHIFMFFLEQEVSTIRVCEKHEYLDLSTEPATCKNCTVCDDTSPGEEPMAFRALEACRSSYQWRIQGALGKCAPWSKLFSYSF